jgi:thiamine kinase-like enzyme
MTEVVGAAPGLPPTAPRPRTREAPATTRRAFLCYRSGEISLSAEACRGLRAALDVASDFGVAVADPVVLSTVGALVVHLRPAPVVARVPTITRMRPGDHGWVDRQIAVVCHLARQGAPVVEPTHELPPGPHRCNGMSVSFWEYVENTRETLDSRRAGDALRQCHEALANFDVGLEPMEILAEAQSVLRQLIVTGSLSQEDGNTLGRVASEATAAIDALSLPMQVVHGDAHLGNVINTPRGPLWNDWDDTSLAPVAWDLGCLHASTPTYVGSGPTSATRLQADCGMWMDLAVLEPFIHARQFQTTVWGALMAQENPQLRAWVSDRLAWFRTRQHGSATSGPRR